MRKFIKTMVSKFFSLILNISPKFFLKIIFFPYFLFIKKKYPKIKIDGTSKKKDLIYLDFNSAIGDILILIRTIYWLNKEGFIFDILLPAKFKGVFEKFNFKNVNIIYKEKKIKNHYRDKSNKKKNNDSYYDVLNESKYLDLSYNKIFYFNRIINNDSLIFLSNVKYNEIILMKNIWEKSTMNVSFFVNTKFSLSIFLFFNLKKFKITYRKNKSYKNLFLADYAYWIFTNELPIIKLSELNLSKYFSKNNNISNNTKLSIMLDKYPRGKSLKIKYLLDLIKEKFNKCEIYLFGDSIEQAKIIESNLTNYNISNYINKTPLIIDYINAVNSTTDVLAYDSSILHISMLLNKKVFAIFNKKQCFYKREKNVWCSYDGIQKIELNKNYFSYYN